MAEKHSRIWNASGFFRIWKKTFLVRIRNWRSPDDKKLWNRIRVHLVMKTRLVCTRVRTKILYDRRNNYIKTLTTGIHFWIIKMKLIRVSLHFSVSWSRYYPVLLIPIAGEALSRSWHVQAKKSPCGISAKSQQLQFDKGAEAVADGSLVRPVHPQTLRSLPNHITGAPHNWGGKN